MAGPPGGEPLTVHLTDDEAELLIRVVADAAEARAMLGRVWEERELRALLRMLEDERRIYWRGQS
jgi:hypothetical protein